MTKKTKTRRRFALPTGGYLWRKRSIPQRIFIICILVVLVIYAQGIAIASWYINKHRQEPLNVGVTFSSEYAEYFGMDPKETFKALRDDLGFRRFRLVTFWNVVEPSNDVFDFSDIDWQLKMIEEVGGSATVSLGLRQPRWPECHFAPWAKDLAVAERNAEVNEYIAQTVTHLKKSDLVTSYQLENEYFLGVFGVCPKPQRQQLIDEFKLIKKIDPGRPVLMSLANNYFGVPVGQPRPDQYAVSVYKRVWDQTITKRYFEYPFTPTYYAYRAGLTEMLTGKSSMLHELQAEPWTPKGIELRNASVAEQNKSMDPQRLQSRIQYAIDTGFRDVDLWGAEWWYWRLTKYDDLSLWNAVKTALEAAHSEDGAR